MFRTLIEMVLGVQGMVRPRLVTLSSLRPVRGGLEMCTVIGRERCIICIQDVGTGAKGVHGQLTSVRPLILERFRVEEETTA